MRPEGADLDLPGRGVDGPRVIRGESEVDGAGVCVDEQDVIPGRAAVRGAKDAAPRLVAFLWPVGVAERRDQGGVGVVGMHDDAADAAGLVQPEVFEAVAAVRGAVDAVADRDVAADEAPPVPTQITFGSEGATAIEPIEAASWRSKIGAHEAPPLWVRQSPPEAAPA